MNNEKKGRTIAIARVEREERGRARDREKERGRAGEREKREEELGK